MNQNQLDRLNRVKKDNPNIQFIDNKITLKAGGTNGWVYLVLVILIFAPLLISFFNYSFEIISIALIWSAFMSFQFYNIMSTSNDILIDLTSKQISIYPTDRLYIALFKAKPKDIDFSRIKNIQTNYKSMGGRYTPIGRRIILVLTNNNKIKMTDFINDTDGNKFASLLADLTEKQFIEN